ncbi:hypothetical protein [Xenorhabdus cabanillasii]|uniref:Uncharacterized protein n=1 Tax=Xenorhabdus cabanillasii JM26 TaxID=1427517 RepID=W1IMJ1_9GAMM|nr:hypothetical protein [Xenorhabdus cabanillasii]PHM78451.1 hypothetical protein Xcab_01067 [Xenorhabdus cabanillasii JM26]CDL79722.1 hypothetical protein XCR1_1220007 [Xenorhabdus cabanillasii JM26]
MTTPNRTQFIVDLVGNVAQRARQFGASIRRFGTDGSRSMRLFSSAVTGANGLLDKFDNRIMGFVTGGGLAVAAKNVADHQQVMTELGTQYNLTADDVNALDAAITKVAGRRKLSTSDLITAATAFLGQTNNLDATLAHLDNIALSINGIKMEATAAGTELGAMFNVGYQSPEKMQQWLDGIASASRYGTGNITDQLSALRGLGKDTKWTGQIDQQQMLALIRVANTEFNDPSQAAAAVQGYFDAINDPEKLKTLWQRGRVKATDKNGQLKAPIDLMSDIGTAAFQREKNLRDIFDGDTLKLAMVFADPKKRDLAKTIANPANITEGLLEDKATQNVQTLNAALISLANAGERFAQLRLAKPVQDLADAINDLTPEELDKYAAAIEKAAIAIGAAVAARYAWRAGKTIFNYAQYLKNGPGAGGAGGNGSGGGLGSDGSEVVPVYVTNWQDQNKGNNNNGNGNGGGPDNRRSWRNNIRGSAISSVAALPFSSPEEGAENVQKHLDKMAEDYPYAEKGPGWLPAPLTNWWYERDEKVKTEGIKPSPYLTGEWPNSSPPAPPDRDNDTVKLPPYLTGETATDKTPNISYWPPGRDEKPNSFGNWPDYPEGRLAAAIQELEIPPAKPADGKITVVVESAEDLKVRTKSVQAENIDLRVNTGYSYGRSY